MAIGGAFAKFAVFALLVSAALPLLLSQVAGGWVRKYTSPNPFTTADIPSLVGKVCIVTGANTGIGLETARELTRRGASVVVATRSESKGKAAVEEIKRSTKKDVPIGKLPRVTFMQLDLASLESIEQFASHFLAIRQPLHLLVLNAGIMKSPGAMAVGQAMTYGYDTTNEGFEKHIGVNHIGHFYLTKLLMPALKKSTPSRVISVSSSAEMSAYPDGIRFDLWKTVEQSPEYEDGAAYGQSKLANLMFARELARRLETEGETGVSVYACHPGIIETDLTRDMVPHMEAEAAKKGVLGKAWQQALGLLFNAALLTREDGALTQLQLGTSPTVGEWAVQGEFYSPIGQLTEPLHPQARNMTLQKLLWTETDAAIQAAISAINEARKPLLEAAEKEKAAKEGQKKQQK